MGDNPGFMLYKENRAPLECLTDEQAGRVFKAIYAYADTGEIPQLEQGERIVFMVLQGDVDRSVLKYEEIREQNRINGEKGGAPAGNQNARKQPKQPIG